MRQRNVNLTEHFDSFIEANIESGRFSDASEIVREGLRLLEEKELEDQAKLSWFQAAAKEAFDALDRGEGITFQSMDDMEAYLRVLGEADPIEESAS